MPHGDWDSASEAQCKALVKLFKTAKGSGYAGNFRVGLATWRACERYGYVRSNSSSGIESGTVVELTASGREIAEDYAQRHADEAWVIALSKGGGG
jgi:hypothetical protein